MFKIFFNVYFGKFRPEKILDYIKCSFQNDKIFIKRFELYDVIVPKCLNTSILYTTHAHWKHYPVKVGSISFFSSFVMQKFHHLLGCTLVALIVHLFFLSAFLFLNLLCQAKILTWIIVSGPSSSRLLSLSRLILSRSIARICLWKAINVTLSNLYYKSIHHN